METENNLSPIEQIRRVEAEIIRQIASAREAADGSLQAAKTQAARLHADAVQEGKHEGEQLYQQNILQAKEAASLIVTQANERADEMRRKGTQRMDRAVRHALHYVLGMQGDQEGRDEY